MDDLLELLVILVLGVLLIGMAVMVGLLAMAVMVCFWTVVYGLRALGWIAARLRRVFDPE